MPAYVAVLILLTFLALSLAITSFLSTKMMQRNHEREITNLSSQLVTILKTNQDLLNRLMAKDPQTYSMMSRISGEAQSSNLTSTTNYSAMSDEAEIAQNPGLGEAMYDEEYIEFIQTLSQPRG